MSRMKARNFWHPASARDPGSGFVGVTPKPRHRFNLLPKSPSFCGMNSIPPSYCRRFGLSIQCVPIRARFTSPLASVYAYARKVALGEIDDPATLPILFEAAPDCDWRDEEIWHRVNPGLKHGYPDLAGLRQFAREAANRPGDRESFRQLNLNIWLDHSTDPFVDMMIYDAGSDAIDLETLIGQPCWIGVDMSTTTDLTAVIACFRFDDRFVVVPFFFCPADNLRARSERDGVPYVQWGKDGLITPTPGNVIDYRAVEQCIRDLYDLYQVQEIAFDVAYAQGVMAPLLEAGFPVMTMRQGWVTQSPALNELERAIVGGKFQ